LECPTSALKDRHFSVPIAWNSVVKTIGVHTTDLKAKVHCSQASKACSVILRHPKPRKTSSFGSSFKSRRVMRRYLVTHSLRLYSSSPTSLAILRKRQSACRRILQQQRPSRMSFHFGSSDYASCFQGVPQPNVPEIRQSAIDYLETFDPQSWYDYPVSTQYIVICTTRIDRTGLPARGCPFCCCCCPLASYVHFHSTMVVSAHCVDCFASKRP